ncbi:peptidyl-tRNA hydrolase protein 1 [Batrachochytrium dendrobatidis]|nr:peptidyl-tRNA hydrolase protein 1 [Batrachochytrium dendrobatidis]KAK5666974.1 peptidyl-tRNA hydrolase protein 1 [Batrachochytrium dendrobatidis]
MTAHSNATLYRACRSLCQPFSTASYSTIPSVTTELQYKQLSPVLVVGLGNFTYPTTRHSVGMILLDQLLSHFGKPSLQWKTDRSMGGWTAEIQIDSTMPWVARCLQTTNASRKKPSTPSQRSSTPVSPMSNTHRTIHSPIQSNPADIHTDNPWKRTITLLKPAALMNISGISVLKAIKKLHLKPSDCIIIHDDIDRKFGTISLKTGGSANGHNGIKSVMSSMASDAFLRLRVGVGRPENKAHVARFVLEPFDSIEQVALHDSVAPLVHSTLFKTLSQDSILPK